MGAEILRVGITRDFLDPDGTRTFDEQAWDRLEKSSKLELAFLDRPAGAPIRTKDIEQFDVLLIKRNVLEGSIFKAQAGGRLPRVRLKLVVRNGAGYDHIDIDGCTHAGVMVSTTPQAVAGSVASAILALMLAFSHRILERDRLARSGQWSQRWIRQGIGLQGRALGVVGLGNIGIEVFRLAMPWKMQHLAYTPRPHPDCYRGLDIQLVDLAYLLEQSDFIALCCPLNDATRYMIDAAAFRLMRRNAFLINTARGEIVHEDALIEALRTKRIAGAGIDVYENEPPRKDHPLFSLDNVILGSHNFAYSDQLNKAANSAVADAVLSYAGGALPLNLLNPNAASRTSGIFRTDK